MSVSQKIMQLRRQANKTQQDISELTGMAVSYLSRLENGRISPSVRTLTRIADALEVPVTDFFSAKTILEQGDHCPVSASGRCILDQVMVKHGRKPSKPGESYSLRQLETLRMCNFLLQMGDRETIGTLRTLVESLLIRVERRNGSRLKEMLDEVCLWRA